MRLFLVFLFLLLFIEVSAQDKNKKAIYEEIDSAQLARIDSIFFSKIPYDSLVAYEDIKQNNIKIILGCGDPVNTNEEFKIVEKEFGFRFAYDCNNNVPHEYSDQRRNEYNNVIISYLDSLYHFDNKREISNEMLRLYFERKFISTKTDKKIKKNLRRKIRWEKKEIKKQVYQADLLYRDRKFQEALNSYRTIITDNEKTISYLINSQYHCLMNLQEFDNARAFYKENKTSIDKIFK
jgi:hypothetical protein